MQKQTKILYRDEIIEELKQLVKDKQFCIEMYDETNKPIYLDLLDTIHKSMLERKHQLNELLEGRVHVES